MATGARCASDICTQSQELGKFCERRGVLEAIPPFPATIPASIESIFEDLERTNDEILIRTTLGLLTYSRGGVKRDTVLVYFEV